MTKVLPFLVYESQDEIILAKAEHRPYVTTIKKENIHGSVYYLLEIDLTQKNLHHYEYVDPSMAHENLDVSHIANSEDLDEGIF